MLAKLRPNHVPGELLVRLKPHSQIQANPEESDPFGGVGTVAARYPLGGENALADTFSSSEILHLKLDDQSPQALELAVAKLQDDPRVAYAVTNEIVKSFGDGQTDTRTVTPDDLHQELYGLRNISAPAGWADTSGDRSKAPLIGVIDSGTDYTHPDLQANIWVNPNEVLNGKDDDGNGVIDDLHGFNAPDKSGDPSDSGSHGTHVAGTVAAVGNNGLGVTGVAWEAQLMPLRFISGGFGTMADAIAALAYGDSKGVRITQNSWGGTNPNQALVDALQASPALHICAAGNSGNDSDVKPLFPAAYPLENILSVAATDSEDQLASFSNYGKQSVDLAAPGVKTYSTLPGGEYGFKSGTSMATPHVSGAASLVLSKFPDLTNGELKDRLMFSTDRLEQLEGKVASGGRLNLARALENDQVRPGAVSALEASAVTPSQVGLRWVSGGDDGQIGRAAAYEIAYASEPFTAEEFRSKAQVYTAAPKTSGEPESVSFSLTPSARERDLFVAVRSVDNVGNRSEMKSLEVKVPGADVAFEDAPGAWTTEGDWGREVVEGRGEVWSDSPGGFYKRDQAASLTSKPFSLKEFSSAELQFDCRHDLEINFDRVFLESRHGGEQGEWSELESFNLLDGWHTEKFDLSALAGRDDVQIRFRLKTDGDVFKDGFQFDRLVVTGTPKEVPA
jgi:subtilisin family serine protease